jgi:hypothetical protein
MLCLVFGNGNVIKADGNVVYWEGMKLVKGQIGKLEIVKPINLWKRENGKLQFVRVLKPGEQYRVYSYDSAFGGQYGVGGNYYITNMKGYIIYKTPPKEKLKLVNPERYGAKQLSIGTVIKESSSSIVSGVKKSELEIQSPQGKQHVYKLDVELSDEKIAIETALSNEQVLGLEPVLQQANRYNGNGRYVLGAVNGDYFKANGSPVDLMVHHGEIITTNTTPVQERVIFGMNSNGKPMIGNPDVMIEMKINGGNSYRVDSINKPRFANHLVIYTPYFSSSTQTNSLGTEVVLTNLQGKLNGNGTLTGTVKQVIVGKGNEKLLPGEIVLSGHGKASQYLQQAKEGDRIEISIRYDQEAWDGVQEAIGGRYRLVANGAVQSFNIAGAHPRTAIGIDQNGNVLLVVVDGRNPNHSNGVTLNELAKLMKDFGAVDAMTLDGGGSSTFVARQPDGSLVIENKPSDGKPRPVANALLVIYKEKADPIPVGSEKEEMIDDFEQAEGQWLVSGVGYVSADVSVTNKIARTGNRSLQISYDFRGMKGTSGVYTIKNGGILLKGYPKRIGMWVYGDGNGHWLRAQLKDGSGKRFWIDFAKSVDWTGWKYVTATVPSNLTLPIMLEIPVRYMEVNETNKNTGTIYVDHISAIYR